MTKYIFIQFAQNTQGSQADISIMNKLKYQGIISSPKTTLPQIQELAESFQKAPINQLFELLLFLHHCLAHPADPLSQFHSALTIQALLRKPKYPTVSVVQHVFLELLKDAALTGASKSHSQAYDFFQSRNFKSNQGSLQSVSYNFTHACLEISLMVGFMKPKRLYRNKECLCESIGKTNEKQILEHFDEEDYRLITKKLELISLRKAFVGSLIEFHKSPHSYIDFFMQQMEQYIIKGAKNTFFEWFRILCREGDVYLTSQALARLVQVLSFHKNFSVRRIALQLITDFLLWGDLEALLLINYTEYFTLLGTKILEAEKRKEKTGIFCFMPEIDGETRQKELFLKEYLLFIRRMATIFPSLDSYFVDSGQAPIYQLYIRLLEHKVTFPNWQDQQKFELQILKNFRKRKELNDLFLEELDKQKKQCSMRLNPLRPTMEHLEDYCQKNRENLSLFIESKDLDSKEWEELIQFKKHFEEYLDRMVGEGSERQIDNLLEEGIELEDRIQHIQKLANRLRQGSITPQEFNIGVTRALPKQSTERSERLSSLKESIRNRDKDSLRYSLTHSASLVKDKLSLKVQKLAKKRSEVVGSISQLELYSRPFLANNIHGKEIKSQFVPILQMHPLRKDKRMRGGLKLLGVKEESSENKFGTPRFRSLVDPKSSVKGPNIIDIKEDPYQKYLSYLNDEKALEMLMPGPYTFEGKNGLKIERGKVRRIGNILQVVIQCQCPNKINQLKWEITKQPSLEVNSNYSLKNQSEVIIRVNAELLKFGYDIPKIYFVLGGNTEKELLLPFSFHNFLTFSEGGECNPLFSEEWISQDPLKPEFLPDLSRFSQYLQGFNRYGNKVELAKWSCNLQLRVEGDKLIVITEVQQGQKDNVLRQLLPRMAARMSTKWRH